jgi:hypothetical protein
MIFSFAFSCGRGRSCQQRPEAEQLVVSFDQPREFAVQLYCGAGVGHGGVGEIGSSCGSQGVRKPEVSG